MSGSSGADINIYKDNGTLTGNRTVTMDDKTLSFNSTATTGTSHFNVDGSTLNVDAVNNRVGIGTTTPNSTFVVEGSYEGAYKEVSVNTTLTIADQFVNITGSVSRTITLPNAITTIDDAFTGRVYNIKNSSSVNMTVKGSGTQLLRIDNDNSNNTIILLPGESIQLVKNSNYSNSAIAVWEITNKVKINNGETIKSSEYAYNYFLINSSSPTNSVTNFGNISVRWPYTYLGLHQHFQIKFNDLADMGVVVTEQNAVPSAVTTYTESSLLDIAQNTWADIPGAPFNPTNADWYRSTIVKIRERAVYKITAQFNKSTTANVGTGRPAIPSGCTIIIEKYN